MQSNFSFVYSPSFFASRNLSSVNCWVLCIQDCSGTLNMLWEFHQSVQPSLVLLQLCKHFIIFPKELFPMNSTMQWNMTLQITHKLLLSYTTIYKTAPLLFCPHKWEFFIFCVSCPHHSCFIPSSSKDLFPTSVIFKEKKKAQLPNIFSVENLSPTTKILSHLRFHYKIPAFPE